MLSCHSELRRRRGIPLVRGHARTGFLALCGARNDTRGSRTPAQRERPAQLIDVAALRAPSRSLDAHADPCSDRRHRLGLAHDVGCPHHFAELDHIASRLCRKNETRNLPAIRHRHQCRDGAAGGVTLREVDENPVRSVRDGLTHHSGSRNTLDVDAGADQVRGENFGEEVIVSQKEKAAQIVAMHCAAVILDSCHLGQWRNPLLASDFHHTPALTCRTLSVQPSVF